MSDQRVNQWVNPNIYNLSPDAKEDRALEAQRVLTDPIVIEALADMRRAGLEALLHVEPTDITKIMQWQAYVAAVDALPGQLDTYVKQRPQKARGVVA